MRRLPPSSRPGLAPTSSPQSLSAPRYARRRCPSPRGGPWSAGVTSSIRSLWRWPIRGARRSASTGRPGWARRRLGDECLDVAEAAGRRVLRATADRSTAAIPFGAVAHLMPAQRAGRRRRRGRDQPGRLRQAVRRGPQGARPGRGRVGRSCAAARRRPPARRLLVDDDRPPPCATVRCSASRPWSPASRCPKRVTRWWRDERATRIDLAELDQLGVDTLLHIALEGPLDANGVDRAVGGQPGQHAGAAGARARCAGAAAPRPARRRVVRSTGRSARRRRLREVVEARLGDLDPAARDVLELLALCQPVGLGQLEAAAGLTVLEELERDGLITDPHRRPARVGAPRPSDAWRGAAGRDAGAAAAVDPVGPGATRGGVGRPTARGPAAHRDLAAGGDRPRRSRPAAASGPPGPLRPRLPQRRHARRGPRSPPSRRPPPVWCSASRSTTSARSRRPRRCWPTRPSGPPATTRWCGSRRCAGATSSGDAGVTPTPWRSAGRQRRGWRRLRRATSCSPVRRRSWRSRGARSTRSALLEQVDVAVAPPPRARRHPARRRAGDDRSNGRGDRRQRAGVRRPPGARRRARHRLAGHASCEPARSPWSRRAASARPRRGAARGSTSPPAARMPLGVIWLGVHLARCALAQGRPETALRWTARACTAIDASGFEGLRPAAYAIEAVAHGLLGDAAASAARADEVDALTIGFGFLAPELPLGRAWSLVASGERRRRPASCSSRRRRRRAHRARARRSLAAPRRRPPRRARRRRRPASSHLATASDSALVAARAEHAAALVAADGDRLAAAAERSTPSARSCSPPRPPPPAPTRGGGASEQRRAAALDVRRRRAGGALRRGDDAGVGPRADRRAAHRPRARDRSCWPRPATRAGRSPSGSTCRCARSTTTSAASTTSSACRAAPTLAAALERSEDQPMTPEQLELVRSSYAVAR